MVDNTKFLFCFYITFMFMLEIPIAVAKDLQPSQENENEIINSFR